MRTLGNIIWHFPFFGWVFSLCYAIGGLFWCITIIGIPLGLGLFQLSLFTLAPFSNRLVSRTDLELLTGEKQDSFIKGWSILIRILYFPFGLLTAFSTVLVIGAEFITIIGIPFGLVFAKALSTIFNPVNKKCVPRAVAEEIERRKANNTLNKYVKVDNTSPTQSIVQETGKTNQSNEAVATIDAEYLRKAEAKTDEELKALLQNKDDYNPQFIKAAEKVLLDRIAFVGKPQTNNPQDESGINIQPKTTTAESDDDKYKAYQPSTLNSVGNGEKPEPSITKRNDDSSELVKGESKSETKEGSQVIASSQLHDSATPVTPPSKANLTVLLSILGGVMIVVVGLLLYFFWYAPYAKDRDAPRTYVVANNVFLRSTQMAGVEYNIVGKIPYGSEVITYSKLGEWAEVKVNGQKGFIASAYLLDPQYFNYLNYIWGDLDTRECIESSKCRLAILDYFMNNKLTSGANGWQVFTRPVNQKPNTVFYPRLYDKYSKYTDFVFIIKDNQTGNRVLVCYSFEDTTEKPIFRFSVDAPPTGFIKSVTPRSGGARVVFDDNSYLNITL